MKKLALLLCFWAASVNAQTRWLVASDDSLRIIDFDGHTARVSRAFAASDGDTAFHTRGITVDHSVAYYAFTSGQKSGLVRLDLTSGSRSSGDIGIGGESVGMSPDAKAVIVTINDPAKLLEAGSAWFVGTSDLKPFASVTTCRMPIAGAVAPGTGRYYSVCGFDDQLIELDPVERRVLRRFSVAEDAEGPVDTAEVKVEGPYTEGRVLPPTCSATSWAAAGGHVWITCNRNASVLDIDATQWKLAGKIEAGHGPFGIAVTPDGKTIVVLLRQGRAVQFFNRDGKKAGETPVSCSKPSTLVISRDGKYALSTCESERGTGELDVFDVKSHERVTSVPVGLHPGAVVQL